MSFLDEFLSAALLIPFFAWGIYALRMRFRFHEEFAPWAEALTLGAVIVFIIIELSMLRHSLAGMVVLYSFAALGIFVATAALYGHMLVSLASQLFVDVILPDDKTAMNVPQFGPVDALERISDHEGAYKECLVMARVFPKEPSVALRIARNLIALERIEEACDWFERALVSMDDPDRSLHVVNRLSDLYLRKLDRHADAVGVLERYVSLYPNAAQSETLRTRIRRLLDSDSLVRPATVIAEPHLVEE